MSTHRHTFWRTGRLLACVMMLLMLLSIHAMATTAGCIFTVTNTSNSGTGSLRQAITDANACSGTSAASPAQISINVSGTITVTSTLPTVTNYMVITGNASGTVISGNNGNFRLFLLGNTSSSALTINDATMQSTSYSSGSGGGVYCTGSSSLKLNNCVMKSFYASAFGGAIYSDGSATVNATRCTFSSNQASDWGGAVGHGGGTATYTNCTFNSNVSGNHAGLMLIWQGSTVNMVNCTVTGNTTFGGRGAIESSSGGATLNMTNTILYGNTPSDIVQYNGSTLTLGTNSKNIVGTQYPAASYTFYSSANPNLGTLTTCGLQSQYPIATTSNAYHSGTTTGAPTTDICGSTRSATPNIGSYESAACTTPTAYTVGSSSSTICSGGSTNITLSGSQTGVNYQLVRNGTNTGTPVGGTGTAMNFAVSSTGTYTITAADAATGACTKTMNGSAVITAGGPVQNMTTGAYYCTIQAAINAASANDAISVAAGSYNEDIAITQKVTLTGAGYATTTVSGPIGGDGATMRVSAAGVIIDGFTITRDGNNPTDWNNPNLNSAGVAVQGTTIYGEVRNCRIMGNRSGIDVNNSNGNNIHDNIIENNRTGIIFRNQTDNTSVLRNYITSNFTVGIVFLDGSGGTNSPVQTAANSSFNNNNISGNWYGDVVDRQSGGSLPAPGTNVKDFNCNWYGTTSISTTTANSAEPGYGTASIPVMYGGTATAPGGQPNIAGPASANIDYTPYLSNGTDNSTTVGFQPVPNSCSGCPSGNVVQNTRTLQFFCSIQDAISDAATVAGDTITLSAGTYKEDITVTKSVAIKGPNAGVNPCTGARGAEAVVMPATKDIIYREIFHVAASNVTISGITINGDNPSLTSGFTSTTSADIDAAEGITVYETGVNNLKVTNNIFKNLSYTGVTLYDYPAAVPSSGHLISNNKFQDLGTYDATSGTDFAGLGVLIYNNQYAAISNNCMDNVRIGVQTGNFNLGNPGLATYQSISDNTMTNVRALGVFHNLQYGTASPYTVSNNTISGVANSNETFWEGVILWSLSVGSTTSNNTINGISAAGQKSFGYEVWNVASATPAVISGGTVNSVDTGIWVHNYDATYGNTTAGTYATLSGATFNANANGTGIWLQDVPASDHKTVELSNIGGVTLNNGFEGLVVQNTSASMAALGNTAFSGQTGEYIRLINNANNINATSATFGGVSAGSGLTNAQAFAIEDKIVHKIDNSALGFVSIKANNDYVTTNSGSIQRGIDAATAGYTVNVDAGTFNESPNVNKQLFMRGAQADVCAAARSGSESVINCSGGIGINASNVSLNGFTVTGQTGSGAPGFGYGIYMAPGNTGTQLLNNIVKNNVIGSSLSNTGTNPTQVLLRCNWFDANNTPTGPASGAGIYTDHSVSGGKLTNVSIDSNKFTGNDDAGIDISTAIASAAVTNLSITKNNFDGNYRAAFLYNVVSSSFTNNYVHNSTGTGSGEVRIYGGVNNLMVANNVFQSNANAPHGVRITNDGGINSSNITVNNNGFYGYSASNFAIENVSGYTGSLSATCNWFGSTIPSVVAPQISGSVTYVPYRSSDDADVNPVNGFQPVGMCASCSTVTNAATVSPLYPMTGQKIQTIFLGYTPASAQTETINVTTTGGTGPFSYAWTMTSPCAGVPGTSFTTTVPSYTFAPTTTAYPSPYTCNGNGDNIYVFTVKASDGQGCTASTTVTKKLNVVNPYTSSAKDSVYVCHKIATRGSITYQLNKVPTSQAATYTNAGDQLGNCSTFTGRIGSGQEEEPGTIATTEELIVRVYPNPSTGTFTVELPDGVKEGADIIVSDVQGKVVARQQMAKDGLTKATFELNTLAKGMYLIVVRDGDMTHHTKIVLQ